MVYYLDHTGRVQYLKKQDLALAFVTSPFPKKYRTLQVNLIEYLEKLETINGVQFMPFTTREWRQLRDMVREVEKQVSTG